MRNIVEIVKELDAVQTLYEKACKAGDEQEQERLSAKILDLETERDWVLL